MWKMGFLKKDLFLGSSIMSQRNNLRMDVEKQIAFLTKIRTNKKQFPQFELIILLH